MNAKHDALLRLKYKTKATKWSHILSDIRDIRIIRQEIETSPVNIQTGRTREKNYRLSRLHEEVARHYETRNAALWAAVYEGNYDPETGAFNERGQIYWEQVEWSTDALIAALLEIKKLSPRWKDEKT